jgi:hypothetical protein
MEDEVNTKIKKPVSKKNKLNQPEDDDEYEYVAIPPDGGFGWVVLVACFVSSYIEKKITIECLFCCCYR